MISLSLHLPISHLSIFISPHHFRLSLSCFFGLFFSFDNKNISLSFDLFFFYFFKCTITYCASFSYRGVAAVLCIARHLLFKKKPRAPPFFFFFFLKSVGQARAIKTPPRAGEEVVEGGGARVRARARIISLIITCMSGRREFRGRG